MAGAHRGEMRKLAEEYRQRLSEAPAYNLKQAQQEREKAEQEARIDQDTRRTKLRRILINVLVLGAAMALRYLYFTDNDSVMAYVLDLTCNWCMLVLAFRVWRYFAYRKIARLSRLEAEGKRAEEEICAQWHRETENILRRLRQMREDTPRLRGRRMFFDAAQPAWPEESGAVRWKLGPEPGLLVTLPAMREIKYSDSGSWELITYHGDPAMFIHEEKVERGKQCTLAEIDRALENEDLITLYADEEYITDHAEEHYYLAGLRKVRTEPVRAEKLPRLMGESAEDAMAWMDGQFSGVVRGMLAYADGLSPVEAEVAGNHVMIMLRRCGVELKNVVYIPRPEKMQIFHVASPMLAKEEIYKGSRVVYRQWMYNAGVVILNGELRPVWIGLFPELRSGRRLTLLPLESAVGEDGFDPSRTDGCLAEWNTLSSKALAQEDVLGAMEMLLDRYGKDMGPADLLEPAPEGVSTGAWFYWLEKRQRKQKA